MGKWESVRLGDVIRVTSGGTPKRDVKDYYENGTIAWAKTGDLKSRYLFQTEEKITEQGVKCSSAKVFPTGTVLVAMYGATIGACSILKVPASTNQACAALLPAKNISENYLYYYFAYNKDLLISLGVGGAQPNISGNVIKNLVLPLPPLSIQQKIADALDKASALIEMRKAQIEKLDLLVKSQFIEMFGDPVSNPKGWEERSFADICEIITDGEHATPRRVSQGIFLLSARNVTNHQLLLNQVDFIDEVEYKRISKRVMPKEDDILLSCSGSIGRCCRVPRNIRLQLVRSVALLRLKSYLNPIFVEYLITSDYVQNQIDLLANKSSQANLFQGSIKKLIGIVPSYDEQVKFANFVELIGEQKKLIKESLSLLENNYCSLMQKCFNGEMNFNE